MIAKYYLVEMSGLGTKTCRTQEYLALDHDYVLVAWGPDYLP